VEQVSDSRWYWNQPHYLVKWKGFGLEHYSWESVVDMSTPELVADFRRRQLRRPQTNPAPGFRRNSVPKMTLFLNKFFKSFHFVKLSRFFWLFQFPPPPS